MHRAWQAALAPTSLASSLTAAIKISPGVGVRLRNGIPQQRSHFFLDVDDDVRLTQIFGETGILAAKLLDFFFHRIAFGLPPTFSRSQSLAKSIGSLSPPIGQQRRVQTFAAKQSADPTWYGSSSLGLHQDALFVLRGIGAPFGFGNHFGIKSRDRPGASARFGCRSTALRLASLAFASFRASQSPRGK